MPEKNWIPVSKNISFPAKRDLINDYLSATSNLFDILSKYQRTYNEDIRIYLSTEDKLRTDPIVKQDIKGRLLRGVKELDSPEKFDKFYTAIVSVYFDLFHEDITNILSYKELNSISTRLNEVTYGASKVESPTKTEETSKKKQGFFSKIFGGKKDTGSKTDESVNYFGTERGQNTVSRAQQEYDEMRRVTSSFDAKLNSVLNSSDAVKISKHANDFLDELLNDDSSHTR